MATVRANGLDFQVSRFRSGSEGDRPVMVGIHGLGIVDNSSLSLTLGMPLAKTFDVVLYDLRGHGRSQFVESGYRVADHVADLVALLDALEIDVPVHVLAGSYGGAVGIVTALEHPERVASLSMVDPTFPHPDWGANLALALEYYADRLRGERTIEEIMETLQSTARRRASAIAERGRKLLFETSLLDDVRREESLSMDDYARISCPVLGVYGEDSQIYVLSAILPELIKGTEIVRIAGANHIQAFHRAETREAITEFVTRVEAERRGLALEVGAEGGLTAPPV
jgi:pimeloyl-ACP methyl ester carboxylesterase